MDDDPCIHLRQYIRVKNAENDRLRKGIQDYLDGDYMRDKFFKTKHDKCPHGLYGWEPCESCIDDYFLALLNPKE